MTFAPARVLEMDERIWQKEKEIWRPKKKNELVILALSY